MTERSTLYRRIAAAVLIMAAVFILFAEPASAKGRIRLSKKKVVLKAGRKCVVKVLGTKKKTKKAKWSIAGKKLVKITVKGKKRYKAVIKAGRKAGKCTVKVKIGKKVLKCKVIVKKAFVKKPISKSSENLTSSFTRTKPSGRKTDNAFIGAYCGTTVGMLKYLNSKRPGRNILISPDSILTALAMTEAGASGNTLAEFENAFGMDSGRYFEYLYTLNSRISSNKLVKYNTADSIWFRKGYIKLKPAFLQKNVNYFNSEIYSAPFSDQTVKDINNWVYNNTRGMIPSVIDNLSPEARLTLINAIAFEGQWEEKYENVSSGRFTRDDGTEQKANILKGTENTYVRVNGAEGFVKKYQGGKIAFMGIETPEGQTVDTFIESLTAEGLAAAYKNRMTDTDEYDLYVHTKMPEFRYSCSARLVNTMKALGIKDAFTESADFSAMTNDPVMIYDIIHKTRIELDRNGTKAAAVTAVIAKASSMPLQKEIKHKYVYLDRPFVYAIIDQQSGLPLFIGALKSL